MRAETETNRRKRAAKSHGGRSKRQAGFDYDDVDEAEPTVEEELASLSDDELSALAELVRQELNEYENALLEEAAASPAYNDDDVDAAVEPLAARIVPVVLEDYPSYDATDEPIFGRPRRSDPDAGDYAVIIPSDLEDVDDDRIVIVPQALEDDLDDDGDAEEELIDELELRSRIAELAEILNERVASGY